MLGVTRKPSRCLYRRGFTLSGRGVKAGWVELQIFWSIAEQRIAGHLCIWSGTGATYKPKAGARCHHWPLKAPLRLTNRQARAWYTGAARRLAILLGCPLRVDRGRR